METHKCSSDVIEQCHTGVSKQAPLRSPHHNALVSRKHFRRQSCAHTTETTFSRQVLFKQNTIENHCSVCEGRKTSGWTRIMVCVEKHSNKSSWGSKCRSVVVECTHTAPCTNWFPSNINEQGLKAERWDLALSCSRLTSKVRSIPSSKTASYNSLKLSHQLH